MAGVIYSNESTLILMKAIHVHACSESLRGANHWIAHCETMSDNVYLESYNAK